MPLSQFFNENVVRISHMIEEYITVLEFFRTDLASKRRSLTTVESEMSSEAFFSLVSFSALGTPVSDVFVYESLQF